jgi:hypothetical protein
MRENTFSRWYDAQNRAYDERVVIREAQFPDGIRYFATSGTCRGVVYEVTPYWCSCKAAKNGDPVCKHRAELYSHLNRPYPTEPNAVDLVKVQKSLTSALVELRKVTHG